MAARSRTTYYQGAGLRLAATVAGDPAAPPVVLLHGGGQTRHTWDATIDQVVEAGWHAVAPDMRGHGDSDWSRHADYGIDAQVEDLAAVVATLATPPVLVGASMGGLTSLLLISRYPEIARALVLVDVAPRIEIAGAERIKTFMLGRLDGFGSLEEAADAIAAYNPARPRRTDLSGLETVLRRREDGRWMWHWDPALVGAAPGQPPVDLEPPDPAFLEQAARCVSVPTLLVRGKQSDVVSEDGAAHLLQVIPHARFVDVTGAGDMVAGDRNDAFAAAVLTFLESLRAWTKPSSRSTEFSSPP